MKIFGPGFSHFPVRAGKLSRVLGTGPGQTKMGRAGFQAGPGRILGIFGHRVLGTTNFETQFFKNCKNPIGV